MMQMEKAVVFKRKYRTFGNEKSLICVFFACHKMCKYGSGSDYREKKNIMKIDRNFVLREIAGEYIIIPTGKTALEFNGLITVNEIGMELWKMLQDEVTFDDLLKGIMEEYDVDEEVAKEDIQDFLDKLIDGGILTEDDSTESR